MCVCVCVGWGCWRSNITYIFDGDNAGAGERGNRSGGGGGGWTHGGCFLEPWGLRNMSVCVCVKEDPLI